MTATGETHPRSLLDELPIRANLSDMATSRRAALYVRVSTSDRGQTVENQLQPVQEAAGRLGWSIVAIYRDEGISGTKGCEKRPGLDAMRRLSDRTENSANDVGEDFRRAAPVRGDVLFACDALRFWDALECRASGCGWNCKGGAPPSSCRWRSVLRLHILIVRPRHYLNKSQVCRLRKSSSCGSQPVRIT